MLRPRGKARILREYGEPSWPMRVSGACIADGNREPGGVFDPGHYNVNIYIMSINIRGRALQWTGLVLLACAAGVLAARPVIVHMIDRSALRDGPWRTTTGAGSADASLYERAAIAVAGLYALGIEETVYYTAFTDSGGQPLDGRCDYLVSGTPPPARWWSLTLYGADNFLVANSAKLYSRHAANLEFDADGSFAMPVSAQARGRNWLPAPAQGAFSITLRLYQPGAAVYRNLAGITLPRIARGSCR